MITKSPVSYLTITIIGKRHFHRRVDFSGSTYEDIILENSSKNGPGSEMKAILTSKPCNEIDLKIRCVSPFGTGCEFYGKARMKPHSVSLEMPYKFETRMSHELHAP